MIYSIKDRNSIRQLKLDKSIKRRFRKIQLDDSFGKDEKFVRKLNKHFFACGCQEGAFLVTLTLFVLIFLFLYSEPSYLKKWWGIPVSLIIAAITGKLIGILNSRFQLRRMLEKLETM
ncbi:hypothetical protein [Ulvibacterium sp.]|uniref:hypothetical protein n=1 Tax=Ulvibacterium sp. TaxID=2665914 RepID=UPI003CC51C08